MIKSDTTENSCTFVFESVSAKPHQSLKGVVRSVGQRAKHDALPEAI